MAESFERAPPAPATAPAAAVEEPLRPVDLDVNLVKNLLASVAGQQGLAGPFTGLLAELERAAGGRPKQ